MKRTIETRLKALKAEYETGQIMIANLEEKLSSLRDTLIRISGAIQVLEEVLAEADSEANGEASQPSESLAKMQPLGELAASGEGT